MSMHRSWRKWLESRTRDASFLWRMVLAILAAGVVAGLAADWVSDAWLFPDQAADMFGDGEDSPVVPDSTTQWQRLESAAREGRWQDVWWGAPRAMLESWRHGGAATLAALTGLAWFAFAAQAAQPARWQDWRVLACAAGVALGVVSIWPTIFFILWQQYAWGLAPSDQPAAGLRFLILGVGLREETAKLLCLAPLLPWLVRRRDELAALMVAGCVGIGFAMEENVNYILASAGAGTLTRLLMPAPLHMAMTGLIGLAAYRACRWPRQWGPPFVLTFGLVVFSHGLYNALFSIPFFDGQYGQEQSFAAFLVFLALIYQFFRELRELRSGQSAVVSLPAVFLFCVSFVAAATFVYLSAAAGFRVAGDMLQVSILAQSIMVYLFLREMPESMVTV